MQQFEGFQFHKASLGLADIQDIRFTWRSRDCIREYGKPVQIFQTKGMQVIGVPPELLDILRPEDIRKANGVTTAVSAHFETEKGFYLLRVEAVCHLALPC